MKTKLWNKDFIIFLISVIQASFGASLSGIALSFLVLKLTGSPSAMAITLALKFLPSIFTPIVATFVDRMRLKPPLIIGNFLRGLALIILFCGITLGVFNVYAVYCVALFNGMIATIYGPAVLSLIPNLIPKSQLARGNSLLSMANQGMVIVGLAGGGVLVGMVGPALSLSIEGICYLIVGIMLFFLSLPNLHKKARPPFLQDFMLGLKMIQMSRLVLMILVANFLIDAIMAPLDVLLPVHMVAIGKGAFGYGLFMTLVIGGMFAGNMFITMIGKFFNSFYGIITGWFGMGIMLLGLGLFNSFDLSLLWAFLLGISLSMLNTGCVVVLQERTPVDFRGRIFGTISAASQIGIPISLFILSSIVNIVTLREIFIVAMFGSITFAIIWVWLWRFGNLVNDTISYRKLETPAK